MAGGTHTITVTANPTRGILFSASNGVKTSGGLAITKCPYSQGTNSRVASATYTWVAPPAGSGPVQIGATCARYYTSASTTSITVPEGWVIKLLRLDESSVS